MIKLAILILVLSQTLVESRPKWHQLENYAFEQYIIDFEKSYDASELSIRKAIFEQNLKEIQNHNSQDLSWKTGVNDHTDMTHEEFKSKRLMKRNKSEPKFLSLFNAVPSVGMAINKEQLKDLPESVDWRTHTGILTPVKNQGHCGSCWAFATTAVIESHVAINSQKLLTLSPQQMVSCTPNPQECGGSGGCEGATAEIAFDYIAKNGQTTEELYPYAQSNSSVVDQCKYVGGTNQTVASIEGFVTLTQNNYNEVMQAVANIGPLAISVDASNFHNYESGIYQGCDYNQNIDIDHAVVLVGYGSENGTDYWIIRNSWGTTYGEDGFIRVLRESTVKCGVDNTPSDGTACKGDTQSEQICGMCGVLFDVAYPVGAKAV